MSRVTPRSERTVRPRRRSDEAMGDGVRRLQEVSADEPPAIMRDYPNAWATIARRMTFVLTDARGVSDFSSDPWVAGPQ